ncbi:MAG: glutathione S-transferase family protein [Alphaproteobacteria bacterium]
MSFFTYVETEARGTRPDWPAARPDQQRPGDDMRLFYSPFHKFIHKVLVTAHEAGLWDEMERVAVFPFKTLAGSDGGEPYSITAINPLNKVPTLALDDGTVIYASQAIVEYLDSRNRTGHKLYPAPGPARWNALRRLALSDTIFESMVMLVMEGWYDEKTRHMATYEWLWPKMIRGLDVLEAESAGFADIDIGQIATLHALSYFDFVKDFYDAEDPIHPNYDWREGRPGLVKWYEKMLKRPSVQSHYMKDWEGDQGDNPERCQEAVAIVLEAQRRNGTS